MYIKAKRAKEFRSLLLASLSLQELSIVGSCVKTVWGSQQVGETLSSSQLSTLRWGELRVNREREVVVSMCLFVEGDQHHIGNPPQFWPIASKNNTTVLQRLPQFLKVGTVYKCGPRVGLKICQKYMIKIYCLWGKTVCIKIVLFPGECC